MKVVKLIESSSLSQELLGGKGYNLQRLINWGFVVPETYVITAHDSRQLEILLEKPVKITIPYKTNPGTNFAVRSSGVGEDGNENSFAGIFDTVLEVKHENLAQAVHKVYASKSTAVTSMYSDVRGAIIKDMAIVIQEMIDADYAGVAFSVNPIERDKKIGLIEIVRGVGESLVSGKVKPTSLRINKITGISRVLQTGTDKIPHSKLESMINLVSIELWKIADLYGKPVDIEWAFKDGKLFLLQARPITTLGDMK